MIFLMRSNICILAIIFLAVISPMVLGCGDCPEYNRPPNTTCYYCGPNCTWILGCNTGGPCCADGTPNAHCCYSTSCCENKTCYHDIFEKCCNYGTGKTCPKNPVNYTCCGQYCCNPDLCQECVNGQCQVCSGRPGEFCCNGSCCNLLDCKICFEGNCMFYCEQENCEECIDGECRVCGNREYEACCGGQCYNINTHGCCDDKTVYDLDGNECCHAGNGKVCNHWLDLFCCGGDCWNWKTQECCWDAGYGYVIDKGKICCNGQSCDPCECESCVDDVCVVCGDNSNQKCCEGSCCDKVWTKRQVSATVSPCSSCESVFGQPLCYGTTTELESYWTCDNVGVGLGEHCECTNTWQTVGRNYLCIINWDVSKMFWCAAHTGWCAFECAVSGFDPAACGNCLAGIDCCGGPCGICDFVKECKKNPYSYLEERKLAFSSFGC